MAHQYEPLALKFAPELYYKETKIPLTNIVPEDYGGLYWRPVPSSVRWADVCIQYVVYFTYQRWVPSILDEIIDILPGNHPNDYAPLFLYFKHGKPVRAVFDICHYEAVGAVNTPSLNLPPDRGPTFHVKNFYRGFAPLEDRKAYIPLGMSPVRLTQQRLTEWWKGFVSGKPYQKEAKLIIRKKLENPFKKMTTFRDHASKLGFLFHWIFRSAKEYQARGLPVDVRGLLSQVEGGMGDRVKYFSHKTIKETAEFVNHHIFDESGVPEYLALRGYKKFQKF